MSISTVCHCKVILISNEGNNTSDCCLSGLCPCNSLTDALNHLEDNTIVNITSQLVKLDSNVIMGSGSLNNVTILGNNATVMCNNKGYVVCRSCSNVILEGITWDRCADSEFMQGVGFVNAINITLTMCTFQHFNTSIVAVFLMASGFIRVQKCQFLFNHVGNVDYLIHTALVIFSYGDENTADIEVNITKTLFYCNGIFNHSTNLYSAMNIQISQRSTILFSIRNSTVSESCSLGAYYVLGNANKITAVLNESVFIRNKYGGCEIRIINYYPGINTVLISSSTFAHNTNGSLKLVVLAISFAGYNAILLYNLTIIGNKGTFNEDPVIGSNSVSQGTGILLWFATLSANIEIAYCHILNNVSGKSSVVYIEDNFRDISNHVKIVSSNFTSNDGPTLYLSNCNVELKGYSSFSNNTAQSGSAIYFAHNSQASIGNDSTIEFTNNIALLFGGAVYVDLPFNCLHQGITFTDLPYNSLVLFTNNSAGIAGNSLYFSIPESCNIIRNSSDNNSIVYIPYQFIYKQLPGLVAPEISTSPYAVNLCSTECVTFDSNNCYISNGKMLGQSIYFNATACDYYNNVSESVQFLMKCIDCNNNYRLSNSKILAHNGVSEFEFFAVDANSDISTNRHLTLHLFIY